MGLGIYINFMNETKDALAFYEQVFGIKVDDVMTYETIGHPKGHEYSHLILNASMTIHGVKVLFSDLEGHDMDYTVGNNITVVINYDDEQQLEREFAAISKDGNITIELSETFWARKYGMVIDKFGIGWQFNLGK